MNKTRSHLLEEFCVSQWAHWDVPALRRSLQTHGNDSRHGREVLGWPSRDFQEPSEALSSSLAPTGSPHIL